MISKKCYLTVIDEVWCRFSGLSTADTEYLWNKFGKFVEGYYWMPAYKLGRWDGKIRFYDKTGKTYYRLLEQILPIIDNWGYEVILTDNRKNHKTPDLRASAKLFGDIEIYAKPFAMRDYQVNAVNEAIEAGSGIILAGTGAGKCVIGSTLINIKVSPKLKGIIKNYQQQSEVIVLPIEELFLAISELECHKFYDDIEYIQREEIFIEDETGYSKIKGLIRKTAPIYSIILENNDFIECADKHILFNEHGEILADKIIEGTLIKTKTGFKRVKSVKKILKDSPVFDIEVDNNAHTYVTANGIVHHNTTITGAISYIYSNTGYKCITIVPSSDLVNQTASWYKLLGMDVGIYSGAEKDINHKNVVATWQALQYNPAILLGDNTKSSAFDVVIWDEVHGAKCDVATKLLNDYGKNIAFRFGVTGSMPKPETDIMNIQCAIGNTLVEIPAKWLIDSGYLAEVEIQPIELDETYVEEEFYDYASEKAFLSKSPDRMELIANIIISKCAKFGNTLVLVNSIPFGEKLASLIKDAVFLYGASPTDLRKEHYDLFETNDDIITIASSGIASTGISIDRIFCLICVDAGKSFIKSIQSIGRGLRKAHDKNNLHVVDIHSKLKFARKHWKEREKHFKEASYPILKKQTLKVKKKLK